jgi:hypothetical protein
MQECPTNVEVTPLAHHKEPSGEAIDDNADGSNDPRSSREDRTVKSASIGEASRGYLMIWARWLGVMLNNRRRL